MKFNDGYWRIRPEVTLDHAVAAYDVVPAERSFRVHVPTRRLRGVGDSVSCPVITVECSSPMPDVVAVTVANHLGGRERGPRFALQSGSDHPVEITVDAAEVVLRTGELSVHADLGDDWALRFRARGRTLTSSDRKCMGRARTEAGVRTFDRLALGVGESVYGLGERFAAFVKNGQVVDCWNDDGGTSSELAYKNIPFYLTDQGYGVFVDSADRVSFEVGSEVVSRVQFSVPGQVLRYFVIYGPDPKDILRKYTALTGRPGLPPPWSFGLWLSTSFTTSYDEETVSGLVDEMAARDIPLSVFHFDSLWMQEFHLCDFRWNRRTFPDPAGMLSRLKQRGLRVSVWMNPYVAQQSDLFEEARDRGFLVRRAGTEDVWQWDTWQAGMGVVDFTNPQARDWFAGQLHGLLDMGVDSFKTDFGEQIPVDVEWHDGSDPSLMHNYYPLLYNRTVVEAIRSRRGDDDAVVFSRSATVGSQQYPLHWGGDPEPSYVSMAESLRGGLSLAMSGFGFWTADIGGFEGTPTPAVYKRWVPFGLLSSHSRLHGSESYRVPWIFDEESVEVLRSFARLKMRLMPYLYGAAHEAHEEGIPVLRPMVLEFPDDLACPGLDRQYLLGPDLLVAPVFNDEGDVDFYVPEGRWTNYLTGAVVDGPRWVRERHGFATLPLLVRPGAVIPVGGRDDGPEYDYRDGVTLEVFSPVEGERTVSVPAPRQGDPATFVVRRAGDWLEVEGVGSPQWRVLLAGVDEVAELLDASATVEERGLLVSPLRADATVRMRLAPS
jgi:alpha-D-xyloside xylohydrolase